MRISVFPVRFSDALLTLPPRRGPRARQQCAPDLVTLLGFQVLSGTISSQASSTPSTPAYRPFHSSGFGMCHFNSTSTRVFGRSVGIRLGAFYPGHNTQFFMTPSPMTWKFILSQTAGLSHHDISSLITPKLFKFAFKLYAEICTTVFIWSQEPTPPPLTGWLIQNTAISFKLYNDIWIFRGIQNTISQYYVGPADVDFPDFLFVK